jgi:transposase
MNGDKPLYPGADLCNDLQVGISKVANHLLFVLFGALKSLQFDLPIPFNCIMKWRRRGLRQMSLLQLLIYNSTEAIEETRAVENKRIELNYCQRRKLAM